MTGSPGPGVLLRSSSESVSIRLYGRTVPPKGTGSRSPPELCNSGLPTVAHYILSTMKNTTIYNTLLQSYKTAAVGGIIVLMSPRPRLLHVSPPLRQANVSHPLIWAVDWSRILMGDYAVVDPHDPTHLTYLSEKEYHKLSNVLATQEKRLIVIAHPFDTRPREEDILAKRPSETSPPRPARMFWSGLQSWLSKSYGAFLVKGRTMFNPAKLTTQMISGLLIRVIALSAYFCGIKKIHSKTVIFQKIVLYLEKTVLKHQGITGLVLHLKTSLVLILKYLANEPSKAWMFGYPVALARGLPRWLPCEIRAAIRAQSLPLIRFIICVLYVYKIFRITYNIPKALNSIRSTPFVHNGQKDALLEEYRTFLREVWIPKVFKGDPVVWDAYTRNEKLSNKFFTPCSAGPNGAPAVNHVAQDCQAWVDGITNGSLTKLFSSLQTVARIFSVPMALWAIEQTAQLAPPAPDSGKTKDGYRVGNVCLLGEPAGKVRAVAILDSLTQRVLWPLHDQLFAMLKRLPWDGTMDQNKLWDKLKDEFKKGNKYWSSIDISSATDSIPRCVYTILLEEVYHNVLYSGAKEMASAVLSLMADREFKITLDCSVRKDAKKADIPDSITYGRGQPMGCLGSFGLLSLWNNSWVAFSCWKATGDIKCVYGVTGDDVVIADKHPSMPIGKTYIENCNILEIPISLAKTFQSSRLMNFLSRTCVLFGEISPVSWKEELSILDGAERTERALKLRDREYWSSTGIGWLSQAIKFFLTPSEYLLHVSSLRKGKLSGYGFRALMSYLVPTVGKMRLLGIQGVPVSLWLSACAGSVTILSHDLRDRISGGGRDRTIDKQLSYGHALLKETINGMLEEIAHLWALYPLWYEEQHPSLRRNFIGGLFIPKPEAIKALIDEEVSQLRVAYSQYTDYGQWLDSQVLAFTLIQMMENLPVVRDFSNSDLFETASESLRSGHRRTNLHLSKNEVTLFSMLWNITMMSGGEVDLRLPPPLRSHMEGRMKTLYDVS